MVTSWSSKDDRWSLKRDHWSLIADTVFGKMSAKGDHWSVISHMKQRKKSERYTIRCTLEQLQAMRLAADQDGTPLNSWILRRVFREDTLPAKIIPANPLFKGVETPAKKETPTPAKKLPYPLLADCEYGQEEWEDLCYDWEQLHGVPPSGTVRPERQINMGKPAPAGEVLRHTQTEIDTADPLLRALMLSEIKDGRAILVPTGGHVPAPETPEITLK